jgi:hypothetical protein
LKKETNTRFVLLALFMVASGFFIETMLRVVQERQRTDEIYKERLFQLLQYETVFFKVFLVLLVLCACYSVWGLRQKDIKGQCTKRAHLAIYIQGILANVAFVCLAYM